SGRIASLAALQHAALDPGKGVGEWLREQGLGQRARVAEGLRVARGWELAVETVLGADLQAVLLDDFNGLDLGRLDQGELRLLSLTSAGSGQAGTLLEKVESPHDLSPWLAQVRPVETLEQALTLRASLAAGRSEERRVG